MPKHVGPPWVANRQRAIAQVIYDLLNLVALSSFTKARRFVQHRGGNNLELSGILHQEHGQIGSEAPLPVCLVRKPVDTTEMILVIPKFENFAAVTLLKSFRRC